jgi:uroporphyrinogen-III synthase
MAIFISREISDSSGFHKLKMQGEQIIAESLIDIQGVDISTYPKTDWIFFYSSNGVKHFFDSQEYSTYNQYAVIGPATANVFYSLTGHSPKYTGNGIPKDVADNFITYEAGKSILFVKAQNSMDSVQRLLEKEMDTYELIAYRNKIRNDINLMTCKYLVFTSPLNVQAYFNNYPYNGQKLYAIGQSTASKINSITGVMPRIADMPSEYELYQLVKEDLNKAL